MVVCIDSAFACSTPLRVSHVLAHSAPCNRFSTFRTRSNCFSPCLAMSPLGTRRFFGVLCTDVLCTVDQDILYKHSNIFHIKTTFNKMDMNTFFCSFCKDTIYISSMFSTRTTTLCFICKQNCLSYNKTISLTDFSTKSISNISTCSNKSKED